MFKPRFNRSNPRVVKAKDTKQGTGGKFGPTHESRWRPVSIKTLGYLAATAKIGILQVHQCLGDKPNRQFTKAFLDSVDLEHPSKQEMDQIQLFSHLLVFA